MSVRAYGQVIVQGSMPAEAPVMVGTLWADTATGLLKQCTSVSPYTFVTIGGTGVTLGGDVVGPSSVTDGHIVRFDGTSGKLIKAGGLIADADVDSAAAIAWSKLSKTGSSLADLVTRSAADLSSGIIPDARVPGFTSDGSSKIRQLAFDATQSASSDANTLDDYEEGSWTPVIGGSLGTSGQTYTTQLGRYVKIGKFVCVTCNVQLSAKGTITGNVQIQGLPFSTEANIHGAMSIQFTGVATNWVGLVCQITASFNGMPITGAAAAATTNSTPLVAADIGNSTQFLVTGVYRASA